MIETSIITPTSMQTTRICHPLISSALLAAGLIVSLIPSASAEVRLPRLLSDNMVPQRDLPIALINASDGGTGAEQWISLEAVQGNPALKPVAVRFGWRQDADQNLINKEGLPASCFRTDKWN